MGKDLRRGAGQSMLRAMKAEADGLPEVGRSGRELGVRIDGPTRDLAFQISRGRRSRSGGHNVHGRGPADFDPAAEPLPACSH